MVKIENKKETVIVSKLSKLKENLDEQSVEQEFRNIAEYLLGNCYIEQGDIEYRFLEVEFYYYSKLHPDIKVDNENKETPFVYPRHCDKTGVFFMHTSGVDICFKSCISQNGSGSNENFFDYGGGILIRSLLRLDKNGKPQETVVAGPWDCCDALFNYTDEKSYPIIEEVEEAMDADVRSVKRQIDDGYNIKMKNKEYCFYNNKYHKEGVNYWTDTDGKRLKRYDPLTGLIKKTEYTIKPWNRK